MVVWVILAYLALALRMSYEITRLGFDVDAAAHREVLQ